MTEKKFRELEDEFGELFFSHAAGYISASKYGLTEMEILEILSVDIQVHTDACLVPRPTHEQ